MMDEFNGIFDYFIGELIDNALRALKENNSEYTKIGNNNDKLMAKIEKLMDKLEDKDAN